VAGARDHAMREDGNGELLEIVGKAEVATIEKSTGLCGALEHEGAARAHAEKKLIGLAGAIDDLEGVVVKGGIDFDARDDFLHRKDIGDTGDRFDRGDRIIAGAAAQDFALGFVRRVAHLDAHEEAIELGLGEGVSAVMLDGVLRGDDEEGLRKRKSASVDGDLRFVHSLEKSGLGSRGGAVDFVGENDVRENGAGAKFKFARFGIVDAHAEDVGGEQV